MFQYIEPHQRTGYLRFLGVVLVVVYFVPAMWGMVLGFAWVLLVGGLPWLAGRWLVEKYFEVNRTSADAADEGTGDGASGHEVPWYADYRRNGRVRRN
jgi:hypothetical protein